MKAWPVIALLFTTAAIATIPISLQLTMRGVELSVDQARAYYGHYRRVNRWAYPRSYYYSCGYYGIPRYWEIPGCYGYPANYFGDRPRVWRGGLR
jgi:hypothetical protein